jgi:DNA-binding XRE family transcriptional regulator
MANKIKKVSQNQLPLFNIENGIGSISEEEQDLAFEEALNELDKEKKTKEDKVFIENIENYMSKDIKKYIEDIIKQQVEEKVYESINNAIRQFVLPSSDNADNNLDIADRVADLYAEQNEDSKMRVFVKQGDKVISDSNDYNIIEQMEKNKNYNFKHIQSIKPQIDIDYSFDKYVLRSRVKEVLKKEGKEQKWLSEKTKIPQSTLSGILNNTSNTSLEYAMRIALVMNRPVEELFCYGYPEGYSENDR